MVDRVNQRVEFVISVCMTDDRDRQNALSLNLLTHLSKIAPDFGVALNDGEAWAVITPEMSGRVRAKTTVEWTDE